MSEKPVVVKDGATYRMLYTGIEELEGKRIERGCYATSADGMMFARQGVVLNPSQAPYASDEVGVELLLPEPPADGEPSGAELAAAPYTLSWNTATASYGLHTLTAVARDAAGNVTTSSVMSVTVANNHLVNRAGDL